MMTVRPYFDSDYPLASEWWQAHGWPAVPRGLIPVVGVAVEINGSPAAMGWLKLESSTSIGMMEWVVSNPKNSPRDSVKAIREVTESIKACAKAQGRTALFTYCKQPSLARSYERSGFQITDKDMIHLVCPL